MSITEAKRKYLKEYRQKNKEYIKKTSQERYIRNREQRLAKVKEWAQNNKDKIRKSSKKKYDKDRERKIIAQKTRNHYRHLRENAICEKCDSNEDIQFHHPEPYRFNIFQVLCADCHREVHGRLLVRKTKQAVGGKNER